VASPTDILKGETAGAPNIVWGGVILAALIYAWYRKKQNSTANTPVDTGQVASDGSTSVQGQAPAEFLPTGPPTASAGSPSNFSSNVDWSGAALRWSIANPNVINPPLNPVESGTAIGDYLAGGSLTQRENAIVNAIISGVGPPPFPPAGNTVIAPPAPSPTAPPPPPVVAKPPPAAPPPPPTHRTYTVVRGDNLTVIGRKYGLSWQAIYNANRDKIKNPNLIYPGQVLVIP
jgi:nucleoid-associated protein YgaU